MTRPYIWQNVRIGGGGFVTGLLFHPVERGLAYARTDIGGAYRWDGSRRRWTPLLDWVGAIDWNLTGVESVAVDPRDPDRLFLAVGTYQRMGNGAILVSRDRGQRFRRTDLPCPMGANEAGRGNGERLVVDPGSSGIVLFGSRSTGLWRSDDGGLTFANVAGFPSVACSRAASSGGQFDQMVGIVFVGFARSGEAAGEPTRTVYAGVSTRETSLYRSRDGGTSWQPVPGQPSGLRPTRATLASDGALYLAYGDDPGPNTMHDGAVWKLDPTGDEWTDVTPLRSDRSASHGFGYGAVTVDPSCSTTLLATTFCRWRPGDELFRSTDGGRTWQEILATARWDHTKAPWTRPFRPHWMSDVKIDPFDRAHAMFTTGYGIWVTHNLDAADAGEPVLWSFDDDGLEETVPLGLVSPPEGAHLLSAIGDLDGFRHDDLDRAMLEFTPPPRFANGEDIAFAARRPSLVVRVGTIRERTSEIRGAFSGDGGDTWQTFAAEPPDGEGAGWIGISADGEVIVWTPRRGRTYATRDLGTTWVAASGLGPNLRVVADPLDPAAFYAFDPASGTLFGSRDAALTFEPRASDLPRAPAGLAVAPTGGGDLWLAARAAGLLHSGDGGMTFARVESVQEAYSLGFGRPARDRAGPALYLYGKVTGILGIFRSDDGGSSFLHLNDDAHQFGAIRHVTGDPRIWGRVYFATGGRGILRGDPQGSERR